MRCPERSGRVVGDGIRRPQRHVTRRVLAGRGDAAAPVVVLVAAPEELRYDGSGCRPDEVFDVRAVVAARECLQGRR
jgi:hypothetical protein